MLRYLYLHTAVRVFMNASIAVESQRQLRLRVEKTGTIANTLTVAVQLLTVANATELGLVLPDDLPSDDSSSPNRAESMCIIITQALS